MLKAKIKQKRIFKMNTLGVVKLTNLSYGTVDEVYRIVRNKVGEQIILYDDSRIGRGIEVFVNSSYIELSILFPATAFEIRLFYNVIEKICNKVGTKTYIRDDDVVNLSDNDRYIEATILDSASSLEKMKIDVVDNGYEHFVLFGVNNPISFGRYELEKINNDLYKFEQYMHNIQLIDAYYVVPRKFSIDGKKKGMYIVGPNIVYVVPTNPNSVVFNEKNDNREWYVMFGENKIIEYDNFINNVSKKEYYDYNHVIVKLSEDEINSLVDKFLVKI